MLLYLHNKPCDMWEERKKKATDEFNFLSTLVKTAWLQFSIPVKLEIPTT